MLDQTRKLNMFFAIVPQTIRKGNKSPTSQMAWELFAEHNMYHQGILNNIVVQVPWKQAFESALSLESSSMHLPVATCYRSNVEKYLDPTRVSYIRLLNSCSWQLSSFVFSLYFRKLMEPSYALGPRGSPRTFRGMDDSSLLHRL